MRLDLIALGWWQHRWQDDVAPCIHQEQLLSRHGPHRSTLITGVLIRPFLSGCLPAHVRDFVLTTAAGAADAAAGASSSSGLYLVAALGLQQPQQRRAASHARTIDLRRRFFCAPPR
jgi:hypothetical protein